MGKMNLNETKASEDHSNSNSVLFKKMTSAGVKRQNSDLRTKDFDGFELAASASAAATEFPEGNPNSVDFHFGAGGNSYADSTSIETASLDNNFQDNLSVDNSSINVSMDLHEASESTLDLREITQSILDLEGTQTSRTCSEYGTSTELHGITQVPSSPPPSYEHVLAETRLAQKLSYENEEEEEEEEEFCDEAAGGSCPPSCRLSKSSGTPLAEPKKGIEIMHKSHKEFYRAVAKQWGITCKMSDHCRCLDCQSMYFDCEYDYNEQEKTDGGLGAGTPMFISEVMHGTACNLL